MIGSAVRQRTAEAWTRTSLAALGLVVVGLRLAIDRGSLAVVVVGASLVPAAAFGVLARQRSIALRAHASPPVLRSSTVLAVTVAVVLVDAAGAVLILT